MEERRNLPEYEETKQENQKEINVEVITEEDRIKMEEMRKYLTESFRTSFLYKEYEKRGWLDRIFTPEILRMEKNKLYTTYQVAKILGVPTYTVHNKRKEFLTYVDPLFGEEGNKNWRHNCLSVFKLKMIDGLTGVGGEYTLPQLKELVYKDYYGSYEEKEEIEETALEEIQRSNIMERMDRIESILADLVKGKIQLPHQIENKVTTKEIMDIYQEIISDDTAIEEKEEKLSLFDRLLEKYPEDGLIIKLYRDRAEEKINHLRQHLNELKSLKLYERVEQLYEIILEDQSTETEKNHAREELKKILLENPNMNFDIRLRIKEVIKEKKQNSKGLKGFIAKLLGK